MKIAITAKAAVEVIEQSGGIVKGMEAECPQFSKEAFTDALVEFVIGDDQVSIMIQFMPLLKLIPISQSVLLNPQDCARYSCFFTRN